MAKSQPEDKQADSKSDRSKKPIVILTIVVIVAAVCGLVYWLHSRNYESTDDAFIDGHVSQISSKVAANVIRVFADDNAEVKKGDVLVELDARDFQVAVEKAKAQLAQARAQVLQARAGVDQASAQMTQAQAQATQQHARYDVAVLNSNRSSSLFQKDLRAVSRQEVDTTKASSDAAKSALEAAQATVEVARSAGASAAAQVVAAEASVSAMEAALSDAELRLSYTKILAPTSGRITRKQVEVGDFIQPGQTFCSLVSGAIWITANFKETQLQHMAKGQPVQIDVDAFPKRDLKGHIDSFQAGTGSRFSLLPAENATGNYVKVVQRIPVKIVFDENPDDLRRLGPGQSVVPTVDISVQPKRKNNSAK